MKMPLVLISNHKTEDTSDKDMYRRIGLATAYIKFA